VPGRGTLSSRQPPSEWAPRHDQAPGTNFTAPEPDELDDELTRFKSWAARIKKYKNPKK
jgi:hypothetical protein